MNVSPGNSIKLHIGGAERRAGWSVLNIMPGAHVDYVGNCTDLSFLGDESCAEVYASHVLEHLGYNGDLQAALLEIFRVLRPGGRLRVAVPDLEVLCKLFLHPKLSVEERYRVMRMMFGGRENLYDVHLCGLNAEFMSVFLQEAGFEHIARVADFDEFEDTSRLSFRGQPISLNVEAYKYYK